MRKILEKKIMFFKYIIFDAPFIIEKTYAISIYNDDMEVKQKFNDERSKSVRKIE